MGIRQPTLHHTSSPPQPPPHLYSPRITLLIQGYSNRDIPSTWPTSKWLTQTLQPKRPSQRPLPKPPSLAQQKVVIPRRDLKSRSGTPSLCGLGISLLTTAPFVGITSWISATTPSTSTAS